MSEREVIETRGDYRAVVIRDEYAAAPDWDGQAIVLRAHRGRVECANDRASKYHYSHGNAIARALQSFMERNGRNSWEAFERYMRVFYGTRDMRRFTYSYVPSGVEYVALDTAALRAEWGLSEDSPYASEGAKGDAESWQAYIDGDVYGIAVEQRAIVLQTVIPTEGETRVSSHESWETVDDTEVWGYYGQDYATSEALAELDHYAPKGGE